MAGDTRNPEHYCTTIKADGQPCTAYRLRGALHCHKHRGSTNVIVARAKADLAGVLDMSGIAPKDYPNVLRRHINDLEVRVVRLQAELETMRTAGVPESTMLRQFGDIVDAQDRARVLQAKLIEVQQNLPEHHDPKEQEDTVAAFLSAIQDTADNLAENRGEARCGVCNGEGAVRVDCYGSGYAAPQPCEQCATHEAENAALTALLMVALAPYPEAEAAVREALQSRLTV
jgi:hypothetical protein